MRRSLLFSPRHLNCSALCERGVSLYAVRCRPGRLPSIGSHLTDLPGRLRRTHYAAPSACCPAQPAVPPTRWPFGRSPGRPCLSPCQPRLRPLQTPAGRGHTVRTAGTHMWQTQGRLKPPANHNTPDDGGRQPTVFGREMTNRSERPKTNNHHHCFRSEGMTVEFRK